MYKRLKHLIWKLKPIRLWVGLKRHWRLKKIPLCWAFSLFGYKVPTRLKGFIGADKVLPADCEEMFRDGTLDFNWEGYSAGEDVDNIDLTDVDASGATNMTEMFYNASNFNQDISNWDVSSVIDMSGMFYKTSFSQNLSKWCVPNIASEPYAWVNGGTDPTWGECSYPHIDFQESNNVADVTIEIYTDSGRTNKIATLTTNDKGFAPYYTPNDNTTYYYSASEVTAGIANDSIVLGSCTSGTDCENTFTTENFTLALVSEPTVTTSVVDNIGINSGDGNGEVTDTGGLDVTERGFVYSETSYGDPGNVSPATSDYGDVENESGTFGTGVFSLTMSSLTHDTTYYVRAYAENSEGYSYGSEVSFTTTAVIETDAATSVIGNEAQLNGDASFTGDAYFQYRETGNGGWSETSKTNLTGVFSETITGLDSSTEYEFKAMLDYDGDTYEGSVLTFTTTKIDLTGQITLDEAGVDSATVIGYN